MDLHSKKVPTLPIGFFYYKVQICRTASVSLQNSAWHTTLLEIKCLCIL